MRICGRNRKGSFLLLQHTIIITLCLSFCGLNVFGAYTPPALRAVKTINKDWKFIKQDITGAQAANFNDGAWTQVQLPHSFDIPYWRAGFAVPPYIGWYRKHIQVDPLWITNKKRIFIEFEAAFLVSQVYVNGTLVGTHKGGYTGFSYDITSLVTAGDNIIAVRLDATMNPQVAPRSGEHIFIGGIYRNVYLVVTDPLHVTWYGTFVSTPSVSTSAATVKIKTEIKNDAASAKTCLVRSIIVDSSGNEVTRIESSKNVAAGALDTFVQTSGAFTPHLWSPATPYMYKVYTEVYDGSAAVDNFQSPLGIRSVRWDKDNGFFLNGQHLWLQGANAHQDHAGWGDATTRSGPERDVRLIKSCGMNFIRGSHYPHHPAFSDACDKYGICLWEEMCYWGLGGATGDGDGKSWTASAYPTNAADQTPFEQNVFQQLREMIRIHRNHPSIIIWSMGNEIWFSDAPVMALAKNLVKKMVAVAHAEDSTRNAGMGGAQRNGADSLSDVAGYNGDGASLFINPGFPSMVAEYGSTIENRPGTYNAGWGTDLQVQNDRPIQYPWRSGVAIWCAFHHGSNAESSWGYGHMGMIDHARIPMRRWYYYRNIYLGIAPPVWPVSGTAAKLKLTTDKDTITDDGTTDAQLIVQVQDASGAWISNSPNVTLTDKSGLGMFPTGSSITFTGGAYEKGIVEGLGGIEFRSYNAGTVTIEATSAGLSPSSVNITVLHVTDPVVPVKLRPVTRASKGPVTAFLKFSGNQIAVPAAMRGKKISLTVFDLQGRQVSQPITIHKAPSHIRWSVVASNSDGIYIAQARTLE